MPERLGAILLILFLLGYLFAPWRFARLEAMQRKAKKVAVKKAARKTLVEELISGGGEVHYGQRNDVPNKEHKKLI